MIGTHFTCSNCPRERDFAQRSRHKMSAMNKMTQCVCRYVHLRRVVRGPDGSVLCCSSPPSNQPDVQRCAATYDSLISCHRQKQRTKYGWYNVTTQLHSTQHASSYVIPLRLLLYFPHLRYCSDPTKCCAGHLIPLLPLSLFLLLFTCTTVPLATCTRLWCDHQLLSHCPYMVQVDLRHVAMNMSRADMTLHLCSMHAFLYTCSHNLCM